MQEPTNLCTQQAFAIIFDQKELPRYYSDQTGCCPVQSRRGKNYIFILYDFDSNIILSTPLDNLQGRTIQYAWLATHAKLQANGYSPQLYIINEECSEDMKEAFTKHAVNFQRVPPHNNRCNASKCVIHKNHFISGLSAHDLSFPLSKWDHLLPHFYITLNHL